MSTASVVRTFAVALICASAALVVGSSAGARVTLGPASEPGPSPAGKAAPAETGCAKNPKNKPNEIWDPNPRSTDMLCGGRVGARIHAGPLDNVNGYQGDDMIFAANGAYNWISGGPGADSGVFDAKDDVFSVEKKKKNNKRRAASLLHADRAMGPAVEYPAYQATFECKYYSYGRLIRIVEEPLVRAIDATRRVDFQQVAWSALLYKQVGEEWVFQTQSQWSWDYSYDENVPQFPTNYWRSFTDRKRFTPLIQPDGAGAYRVAVWIHWYATKNLPAQDLFAWGGRHYGDYEDGTHRWCSFPI